MTKLIQDCWQGNAQKRPTMAECVTKLGIFVAPEAYHWLDTIEGHSGSIECVAVLPTGNIVSGSSRRDTKGVGLDYVANASKRLWGTTILSAVSLSCPMATS